MLSHQSQVRDKIHSLDTRSKIVDAVPEDASFLKVVVGYFDPSSFGSCSPVKGGFAAVASTSG